MIAGGTSRAYNEIVTLNMVCMGRGYVLGGGNTR